MLYQLIIRTKSIVDIVDYLETKYRVQDINYKRCAMNLENSTHYLGCEAAKFVRYLKEKKFSAEPAFNKEFFSPFSILV